MGFAFGALLTEGAKLAKLLPKAKLFPRFPLGLAAKPLIPKSVFSKKFASDSENFFSIAGASNGIGSTLEVVPEGCKELSASTDAGKPAFNSSITCVNHRAVVSFSTF